MIKLTGHLGGAAYFRAEDIAGVYSDTDGDTVLLMKTGAGLVGVQEKPSEVEALISAAPAPPGGLPEGAGVSAKDIARLLRRAGEELGDPSPRIYETHSLIVELYDMAEALDPEAKP